MMIGHELHENTEEADALRGDGRKDTADLIEENKALGFTDDQNLNPVLFFVGFTEGLTKKDISPDIEKCVPAQMKISKAIQKVIQDLMLKTEKGVELALEDSKKVLAEYKESLKTCAE